MQQSLPDAQRPSAAGGSCAGSGTARCNVVRLPQGILPSAAGAGQQLAAPVQTGRPCCAPGPGAGTGVEVAGACAGTGGSTVMLVCAGPAQHTAVSRQRLASTGPQHRCSVLPWCGEGSGPKPCSRSVRDTLLMTAQHSCSIGGGGGDGGWGWFVMQPSVWASHWQGNTRCSRPQATGLLLQQPLAAELQVHVRSVRRSTGGAPGAGAWEGSTRFCPVVRLR